MAYSQMQFVSFLPRQIKLSVTLLWLHRQRLWQQVEQYEVLLIDNKTPVLLFRAAL